MGAPLGGREEGTLVEDDRSWLLVVRDCLNLDCCRQRQKEAGSQTGEPPQRQAHFPRLSGSLHIFPGPPRPLIRWVARSQKAGGKRRTFIVFRGTWRVLVSGFHDPK